MIGHATAARLLGVRAIAVVGLITLRAIPAAATELAPAVVEQPRRNVRIALALGQGVLAPPVCSDCASFWGRSLSLGLEVGVTLRPDLVISLEEQLNAIHFADDTDGLVGGFQLVALYFFRPRTWLLGGAGLGLRAMAPERMMTVFPRAKEWSHAGVLVSVGAGHELGHRGALAFDVQARAMAVIADALAPGICVLVGAAWN
jgi:hypothetical protein